MDNIKTSSSNDPGSNIFLTGTILLANLDYSGLLEYALRAIVGGALWMGFKIGTDYLSERVKRKSTVDKEKESTIDNKK